MGRSLEDFHHPPNVLCAVLGCLPRTPRREFHYAMGGETYLKSEDWNGIENWWYRQTDYTAIQIEVMHSTAWHKCIFILYAMPG